MPPSLTDLWDILTTISHFTSSVKNGPNSKTGWTGTTTGTVKPRIAENLIVFIEHGTLTTTEGKSLATSNHWQWSRSPEGIQFYHRRRDAPVLLAELNEPASDGSFHSQSPHLCGADVYTLRLDINADSLHLKWRITGPKKDEVISTLYT